MTNVFVGNLASNRTPDELRTLFQTYGPVEGVKIITDPETRYSRGFAFVNNDQRPRSQAGHLRLDRRDFVGEADSSGRGLDPGVQHSKQQAIYGSNDLANLLT